MKIGDKVCVEYQYDDNFKRNGVITKVVEKENPSFGIYNPIWEITFDDGNFPNKTNYNELWLTVRKS